MKNPEAELWRQVLLGLGIVFARLAKQAQRLRMGEGI
ncbi:hypothetical protein NB231_08680 [Nitrococcus mobilis Nb-231]|uniref:Uncharacterized protein n=1 Tax=Nitrococcus mobilis Nb-231 TaxID=314278 RepID=A4BSP9_9GAMM|nr:hypothetical protein NB231_08680 [Nitrococcus mobilis Nb-231]